MGAQILFWLQKACWKVDIRGQEQLKGDGGGRPWLREANPPPRKMT